jgi:O-antigen ligase/polysaccharide polymerase Wzy-like membrane protein
MATLACVSAAFGCCLVLLTWRRSTVVAGFVVLAVAEALVEGASHHGLGHVTSKRLALVVFGLGVLIALAAVLVRRPELVPLLAVIAAPFRLPLHFGGGHLVSIAHGGALGRLLPLYLVLGSAALALVWRLLRGEELRPLPRVVAYPMAAFLAYASLSVLWSSSTGAARGLLQYFLVPFAVLVVVVARSPFPRWMPRALGTAVVALATVFAVIGLVEEATHKLLFYSSAVAIGNTYSNIFRVTSLFRDPSLYGRHVVVGMAILVVALWYRDLHPLLIAALLAVLFGGLLFSFSQSSFAALFAVVVGVTLVAGDRTVRTIVAAFAVVVVVAGAGIVAKRVADVSAQRATSDRSRRVELTAKVLYHHPLFGVGIGSQPTASQALSKEKGPPTFYVSHTTPLTVGAELGIVGLGLYTWLLVGTGILLERVRRVSPAYGLGLAAVFVALLVHSLFYTGFFDDPYAWLVPALAAGFLLQRQREPS